MKFLFLRGQVPQDRNPQEIVFDTIEEVDDVWTQLLYSITHVDDYSEIWYWGGTRNKAFADNFIERWIPSFTNYQSTFEPDVIFCRGGFKEYHDVLRKYDKAFKIYYGAGIRFIPLNDYTDYDLVLVDSEWQMERCKQVYPNIPVSLFIKPAPDNLFDPKNVKKEYDICFPADGRTKRKGHSFVYNTIPTKYSVLNLGSPYAFADKPDNVTSYRVLKKELPYHMSKCKMGIVTSTINSGGGLDSCPRVLPEMLACDLPIVVLDETLFWKSKYITSATGVIASRSDFWDKVQYVLDNLEKFSPRKYYDDNLSLECAAEYLRDLICV